VFDNFEGVYHVSCGRRCSSMLLVGVSATLLAHGLVDVGFFAFVGTSRVCSFHNKRDFLSKVVMVVGNGLVLTKDLIAFQRSSRDPFY
jgi:hypothetical protein